MRHPTRTSVSAALRQMARPTGRFDAARYFRGDHGGICARRDRSFRGRPFGTRSRDFRPSNDAPCSGARAGSHEASRGATLSDARSKRRQTGNPVSRVTRRPLPRATPPARLCWFGGRQPRPGQRDPDTPGSERRCGTALAQRNAPAGNSARPGEAFVVWIIAVVACVLAFALVKVRRRRKWRQSAS